MKPEEFEAHCEVIYHRCYRLLKNKDMAYDALQEVLTRYYEVLERQDIRQPLHYLFRISTNHCLDVLREQKRTWPTAPEAFASLAPETYNGAEHKLLVERLLGVLDQNELDLLVYRHMDCLTYQEIGEMYHMSDRGIKKRMDKLETKLRDYLSR